MATWYKFHVWCKNIKLDLNLSTILDESPWDSTSIFIFFCHFLVPSLKQSSFSKLSLSSPSPQPYTMYKVETRKKFRIHASNIVCWVRGGLGLCELENAPEMQKYPKTFVHDCSFSWLFHRLILPYLYLHSLSFVPQVK